mgnify:CR=1 FL=1
MNDNEINDKRKNNEFKGGSFSGYKKSDVVKTLIKSFEDNKIEDACYWSGELICSCHYIDLWEVIILYMSKHIHLANPKLAIYINMRYENFKTILLNGYIDNEIALRNNPKIRTLFAEIMGVLCNSRKNHILNSVKISQDDFDLSKIQTKLKAPDTSYAKEFIRSGDPKELFISINEFIYHLSVKDVLSACYWIEWIIEFNNTCTKNNNNLKCERREFIPVKEQDQMHVIWMIWDICFDKCKNNTYQTKIIESLLNLYTMRFSKGAVKRRRFILYLAVSILLSEPSTKIPVISNTKVITFITSKIDNIYKQIKKNEQRPDTDYLFNGVEKSNLDKTIAKLDMMNNNVGFIPRLS